VPTTDNDDIVDLIEDEDLKAEVIQLNLTLPHSQSMLDPAIGDFHPQLYYKLLAMESYTYQRSESMAMATGSEPAGPEQYGPFWEAYNTALMSYVGAAPISNQQLKDFFIGFFCFVSVHIGREMGDPELIPKSDAKKIFNFGGYYENTVKEWPLNHFDDFVPGDPMAMPEPTVESAENLTAAPESVEPLYGKDAGEVAALNAQFADVVSDAGMQAAFSNPTVPKGALSPTEIWDLVFDELNWMWYIETFGSTVAVPERPEPIPQPTPENPNG
jgi:hypothetical protein